MSTATYRFSSLLSLDWRKYISVVSNSTYEHDVFFLSACGTELGIVLTVQKIRMFWSRERRGNSGNNGCGVRRISDNEALTRERQEECSRNASVFSGCLFHVSDKSASRVRVLV